jgi:hypothetical protein
VLAGHQRLKLRLHPPVVPVEQAQELLQRPGWDASRIGDRLTVLPRQIRQLSLDIHRQMTARVAPQKTVVKLRKKFCELRPERANLFGIHAWNSSNRSPSLASRPRKLQEQLAL